ncbi:MAG: hypothetical protein M1819_003886 [Sarea resinae]|nr:MAG: hypothetical protein M1819_003886 [Sarea resinae]
MSKMLARDLNTNVYAVDLRNHGDSPHDARHDYSAMADDIEGFIAEHKLETPTLIGHSMGAKTAMVVALRKPDLVSSIIPVDNAPIDAALQGYFGKYMQGMKKIEAARVKSHKEADAIFQEYEKDLPIRQFILTNLTHTNDPETQEQYFKFRIPLSYLAAALDKMGDFPFKDPDTTRFVKPTLFVRGTKSHYVADEALPVIGQFFPRFELVDIDCGHWVIAEEPEKFRKDIISPMPYWHIELWADC